MALRSCIGSPWKNSGRKPDVEFDFRFLFGYTAPDKPFGMRKGDYIQEKGLLDALYARRNASRPHTRGCGLSGQ